MATINFYLDKPDKKGLAPIHLRINCNGSQIKLATGQKIETKHFDKKNQKALNYCTDTAEINHYDYPYLYLNSFLLLTAATKSLPNKASPKCPRLNL